MGARAAMQPVDPARADPPHDSEEVVVIMGMTGSGKSTFLNLISGTNSFKVGHNLESETANIQEVRCLYEDTEGRRRTLCLLDTPGFGDTTKLESDTLDIISNGLSERSGITGIIYLHNINEVRLTHLARQVQNIFNEVWGKDAMKHVVLCTSQWDKLMDKNEGESRLTELCDRYWKNPINQGARVARHDNSESSAAALLALIIGKDIAAITPQIVTELALPDASLASTSAGKVVNEYMTERERDIWKQMEGMKADHEELRKELSKIKKEKEVLEKRLKQALKSAKPRKIGVLGRIFGGIMGHRR